MLASLDYIDSIVKCPNCDKENYITVTREQFTDEDEIMYSCNYECDCGYEITTKDIV